ncbi:SGNH hydrolase-type esterase domain-containing protein [Cadophora sp. MPI-SDFR-AT-0126]|nr:SGNH hydrolase-type esterase domain-containing protein [Leotiomycetes sp. MPI-SDFR-AT-0126]
MRVCTIICSVAALACTVSSSPPKDWFKTQLLGVRAAIASTATNSRLEGRDGAQLRILVAGASIASGFKSSDGNGFRLQVRDALIAAGNDVQMVGTVNGGSNNAYVGQPGLRIDEVMARLDAALPKISPPPNIVLVQVGANDLGQKFKVDTMQERISMLVDHVCTAIPGVNVVLSTLLPNAKTDAGAVTYNSQLRTVAAAQTKQGRNVYISDVHSSDFSLADILPLPDGTHPTDAGYSKMAHVYLETILGIVKTNFAPPPVASTSPSALEMKSTSVPVPTTSTVAPETTNTSAIPISETTAATTSSSQAQRQLASTSISTSSTATQIAKELPSNTSTAENSAASTTGTSLTPSASASAESNSGSRLGRSGHLITAVVMLAWTFPLFRI